MGHKRNQSLSEEEKKKSDNMVVSDTKIYLKMKNKSLVSIKGEKTLYYKYKKLLFRKD